VGRSDADLEHESLCRRCARCCYEKYIIDDHVFTTRRPCPHLDARTRLCTIYGKRFELNPRCLDVKGGIELGVFPAYCPYVRGLRDYRPSEEGWLDERIVRQIENGTLYTAEQVRDEMKRVQNAE
jgi:uncharacterized cysteine cluster protein YcgN (CxxCxxCC family)